MASTPLDRAAAIRTVHRLRAGIPPAELLAHLTAGDVDRLRQLVLPQGDSTTTIVVTGYPGHGKSHHLSLFSELAASAGLASCYVSLDGGGCAPNHPQRFIAWLLASLEVPGIEGCGYQNLVHSYLDDAERAEKLLAIVSERLASGRVFHMNLRSMLGRIVQALRSGDPRQERARLASQITHHLTGRSISHMPGALPGRQLAYDLLSVASDVVIDLGGKGLLIAVDELESVYTKLPSLASRRGAYRVLAHLCCSIESARVLLAITPEALDWLRQSVPGHVQDHRCLPTEVVHLLPSLIRRDGTPTITCGALTPEERVRLLERVRLVYEGAFPGCISGALVPRWIAHVARQRGLESPTRLLVRQAIDFLDVLRYSSAQGAHRSR